VPLNGSSGVKGYADLSMIAPFTFRVTLVLSGLTPGASYNAATRGGLFEYSSMRAVYTPYAGGLPIGYRGSHDLLPRLHCGLLREGQRDFRSPRCADSPLGWGVHTGFRQWGDSGWR